jgi:catechol 2,3-dioxygenase-like lactoylglutathione lyase family enzyme
MTSPSSSAEVAGREASTAGITHVGLTVPDLEHAIAWYQDVLGWRLVMGPVEIQLDDSHIGLQIVDVFGPRIGGFRQAHMDTGNAVAVELFQFLEPRTAAERPDFDYWRPGVFHVCLVATDIDALVRRIAERGGRLRTSKVWDVFPGEPYRMAYCEDPFGNVLELYSHPHEQVFRGRAAY